jgi:hypothetical protein
MCTYVNILSDEKNALANHTETTMLVSHIFYGDVVFSCFDVMQGTWLHDIQSHVSGDSYTCHGHSRSLLDVNT